MHKIVALVGMTGSGKSEFSDWLAQKGYHYVRFGQITLDEVKKRGLEPTEENERPIREEFRKQYGPGAFAILNIPKFDETLKTGDVVVDGIYSWSEYKILKEKYGENLIVVAICAPPKLRYERLASRAARHGDDPKMKFRSFTPEAAKARDYAEIENIEKGGPIAMADYTILNTGTLENAYTKIENILKEINKI
ncbi:MAG: AAA family ATPase [Patescibacteria group bacterium]